MKLRYSPTSPYVRKVLIVALETGLDGRIDRIATDPWAQQADLLQQNPLSKVPVLVTDEQMVLYDSVVICEYLDTLHEGPRLLPASGDARWGVLRLQALSDGVLDASVLLRLERMRPPQQRSPDWQALQTNTVYRGLDALESEAAGWNAELNLGHITAGCALGYLEFRFPEEDWRAARPALAHWYRRFAQRPSMETTRPSG